MRAYFIQLAVAAVEEAVELARRLADVSIVELNDNCLSVLWPAPNAGVPEDWGEHALGEFMLLLQSGPDGNLPRTLTVLDERPVEVAEQLFRGPS